MNKYPLLQKEADFIVEKVVKLINDTSPLIPDEGMPYKSQHILEEVVKQLKDRI